MMEFNSFSRKAKAILYKTKTIDIEITRLKKDSVLDFWADKMNFKDSSKPIHNPFIMADFVEVDCIVIISFQISTKVQKNYYTIN